MVRPVVMWSSPCVFPYTPHTHAHILGAGPLQKCRRKISLAVVLADVRPAALFAVVYLAVVLADARPCALLELASSEFESVFETYWNPLDVQIIRRLRPVIQLLAGPS
jgi:hypothetical protein